MPDNSFEKKVRDKLNTFGLPPTTRVWEGVEAKLHQKRKRDRGILWLVFALLLLGGSGYFLFSGNDTGNQQIQHAVEQKKESDADLVNHEKKLKEENTSSEKNITASETTQDVGKQLPQSTQNSKPAAIVTHHGTAKDLKSGKARVVKETNEFSGITKPSVTAKQGNEQGTAVLPPVSEPSVVHKPEEETLTYVGKPSPENQAVTAAKTADVPVNNQKQSEAAQTKEAEKNEAEKKLAKENKKSWQFGISANIGLTGLPQYFLAGPQKSMRADNLNIGSLPGVPPMAPPMSYPYSQEQESGWGAGLWARKDLSKKMALSVGLQYQFYSTSTKTGYQATGQILVNNGYQNVSLDNYYLPGSITEYRNRYHLIQLPLQIRSTFGKKNLLPVSLTAGIQPGWLAASNALLKDSSGILYSDKANFNRFQFGLNAGVQVRLFNKSRMPLDIGPVFQYQLTDAFRKKTGYSGHLLFVGLQADLQLFNPGGKQRQ